MTEARRSAGSRPRGRSGGTIVAPGASARFAAGLLLLAVPAFAAAAELRLDWAGGGTDRNPGAWTIRLTGVEAGARGSYTVDGGPPRMLVPGAADVAVPATLGVHRIEVTGPAGLSLADTRTIVDDDPTPPDLTIEYAGKGTRLEPGVWMITLFDPESPQATGTYRVNDGPIHPLAPGTTVVAVPYFPGTYTITVTATNNDRDSSNDEDVVTRTDTREVK